MGGIGSQVCDRLSLHVARFRNHSHRQYWALHQRQQLTLQTGIAPALCCIRREREGVRRSLPVFLWVLTD
jgi:hypothetical protein